MATNNLTPVELFAQQKKRHAELSERRTRAQVQLEAERRALAEAREEAKAAFGTEDLDALRALFRERSADNERKVMELMMALDEIENSLTNVERQIAV